MPRLNARRLIPFPKILTLLLLALSILALSGCFFSDDDDPAPVVDADPTGYYTNSGFVQVMMADDITPRSTESDFQGMVTGSQFMMLSDSENLSYIGTFTVSGNDLSGSVTVYEAGVMVQEDVPVSGVITVGSKITGTLGGSGVANGTFGLDYASDNGPVDLGMVVRTFSWQVVSNPNIPTLGLQRATDTAAEFNFKSSAGSRVFDGCGYLGHMEPVTGTHLYTVSVTMDTCVPATMDVQAVPSYTGLASLRGTDRFILALSNGAYDFSGEYFECLEIFCTP